MIVPIQTFLQQQENNVIVKTDIKVDIGPIVDFFRTEVKVLKKTYQTGIVHGGWSIQSNNGQVSDGWQSGSRAYKMVNGRPELDEEWVKKNLPNGANFNTPTDLYKGPASSFIQVLAHYNLQAKRTRFSELEPGGACDWHVDGPKFPRWRGHVAIQTNPDALFQFSSDGGNTNVSMNIPADGHVYFIRLDATHRVINTGSQNRVHVMFDYLNNLADARINVEPVLSL